jgi:hypothetical protein
MRKTTAKDFTLFKETAINHLAKLGLYNWRIEFRHVKIPNCYATTDYNVENHCAIIKFTTTWHDDDYSYNLENIKTVAKHEIHHILLAKLAAYASYRFVNKIMLDEMEEEIIRILDKVL